MYRIALCIICLASVALAQNHIEVIYPKDGQQIQAVDSTFIFGNTHPKAKLQINGYDIPVYKDGGYLAFLPVEPGSFYFELMSDYNGDVATGSLQILVGDTLSYLTDTFIKPSSVRPSGRTILIDGEILAFSFKARPDGRAYCMFENDSSWTEMFPESTEQQAESVFGGIANEREGSDWIDYTGYLSLDQLNDSSRVFFQYQKKISRASGKTLYTEFEIDSTDYYVAKIPALPPRAVVLEGRPRIIRVGPGLGYKLVNQPSGIRFIYAGETQDYYRLRLADGSTGYVRKIDSSLKPAGSMPEGKVSFIEIDDYENYVEISMAVGDKLPYEIHTDGDLMTVDLFYLVSDTDWIRFNGDSQKYVESIWWSQPYDGVYRLNIRWYDKHFWGYKPGYDEDKFVLKLKKNLDRSGFLRLPVKGLKIVIDPGHSHDPGAIGPTGLREENPNLWIAYELRKILMKKGAEVLMTRMGHENVGLYDRVDMANKWGADLLISIHNNALPDGVNPFTHSGTSAYYYFDQARPLAEAIHKHMLDATGLPDHGLYHGNLALCRVTECPSVLIECAFMMIPEQEAMLKTDKFQRKCAKAIYQGICDYLKGE